jgi:hypothetical protein
MMKQEPEMHQHTGNFVQIKLENMIFLTQPFRSTHGKNIFLTLKNEATRKNTASLFRAVLPKDGFSTITSYELK